MKVRIGSVICMACFVFSTPALSGNLDTPVSDNYRDVYTDSSGIAEISSSVDSSSFSGTGSSSEALFNNLGAQGVDLSPVDMDLIRGAVPPPVLYADDTGLQDGSRAEALLPPLDARVRVYPDTYPARATVLILFGGGYMCSGALIDTDLVVTAGHCVHSGGSTGSWYASSSYTIYPGYSGSTATYGSCGATTLASVGGWIDSGRDDYDYGAIKLNCTVGNTTGWFGFFDRGLKNKFPTTINGYPGDKPNYQQWWSNHNLPKKKSRKLFYKNDTIGGMSGSPVWMDKDAGGKQCGNGGACIFGIHAYKNFGTKRWYRDHNSGTRVNKYVYSNFLYWKSSL